MKNGSGALRRLLLVGCAGAAAVIVASAGSAQADNGPHVSGAVDVGTGQSVMADGCAGCHRAHTAKGSYLLKSAQEFLCFTCHGSTGGGARTNVVDGIGYTDAARTSAPAALRGGGFDYALIGSATPTKETYLTGGNLRAKNQVIPVLAVGARATSKHSVGTTGTAWGNGAVNSGMGASVALECGSCHNPHGNGNYRILRPIPVDAGTQVPYVLTPAVVGDLTAAPPVQPAAAVMAGAAAGVAIPDAITKVYTTKNYWLTGEPSLLPPAVLPAVNPPNVPATVAGLPAISPDGFIANISDWCSTCHTRYLAGSGSYKTDSGDATFKFRHRSNRIDKVGAANCITCHVAHGSNANMNGYASGAVTQPNGTAAEQHAAGQVGSRLLRVDNRGICVMCHNV